MSGESLVLIILGIFTLIGATVGPYLQYRINKKNAPAQRDVSVSESAKSLVEGGSIVNEMLVQQLERMSQELERLRHEQEQGKVINGKGIPEQAGPVIYDKLREIEQALNIAIETMSTRQRIMFQTVGYPVYEANAKGRMIWVNRAAAAFVGATESELVESGWVNYIHPDDQERVWKTWTNAITQGALYNAKFRCLLPSGEYVNVHAIAHPIVNSLGEVSGYLGFVTRDSAPYDIAIDTVLKELAHLNGKVEGLDESIKEFREDYDLAVKRSNEIFAVAEANRKKIEAAGVEGLSRLPYDPDIQE